MRKVECIIRPEKLEEVKQALGRLGIHGMTVSYVQGCGREIPREELYRGQRYQVNFRDKIKLEVVVHDNWVNEVVRVVSSAALTGEIGDGKLFIYQVEEVIRIRTGEHGEDAL